MRKWIIIITLMFVMIQTVSATHIMQVSGDNTTWIDITNITYGGAISDSDQKAYAQNLNCSTMYYVRAKDDSSSFFYSTFNTDNCGEAKQEMGALAITVFMLFIIGGLYVLPFRIEKMSNNPITNHILKKGCLMVATFLLMMSSAIMATIASTASIPVTDELFTVMWIVGRAGWLIMIWLVFGTLFETIKLWQQQAANKRMGEDGS